jgi:hypothetical protein
MKTNKQTNKPSRLFILGITLLSICAGLEIATFVSDSLESKPAKASQKYQIPADRPLITDFNQKR